MDPNETLRRLRELAERELNAPDPDHADWAEWFQALDQWITSGGFLPYAWVEGGAVEPG